jgi:hypothetical protein
MELAERAAAAERRADWRTGGRKAVTPSLRGGRNAGCRRTEGAWPPRYTRGDSAYGNPGGTKWWQPFPDVCAQWSARIIYPKRRLATGERDLPKRDAYVSRPFHVNLRRIGKGVSKKAPRRRRRGLGSFGGLWSSGAGGHRELLRVRAGELALARGSRGRRTPFAGISRIRFQG